MFDYYRPCEGAEFKNAIRALVECKYFPALAAHLYPQQFVEEVKQMFLSFEDVYQFQHVVMWRGCEWVVENTMDQFTFSGVEYLDGRPCLFVSNHRDIVLDAMMLQYILVNHGLDTSYVVVGANLFEMDMMRLLARTNKMYDICRGGTAREYYKSLMEMSQFLRHQVTQCGASAWIAQRNGRTKDGNDRTDPALIKMIAASGDRQDPVAALNAMHIVPVSVSYEWEPCGIYKARELFLRQQGPYTKADGEDTQSVLHGITDYKGRVHFAICPPLTSDEVAAQDGFEAVAQLIDQRISQHYHLWPNNHIAKAMLEGQECSLPEASRFRQYVADASTSYPPEFRRILLGIYANAIP